MKNCSEKCECKYCQKCLKSYIVGLMHEGHFSNYRCPNVMCDKTLNDNDVKKILNNAKQFGKY
jgi:hypothetical protein